MSMVESGSSGSIQRHKYVLVHIAGDLTSMRRSVWRNHSPKSHPALAITNQTEVCRYRPSRCLRFNGVRSRQSDSNFLVKMLQRLSTHLVVVMLGHKLCIGRYGCAHSSRSGDTVPMGAQYRDPGNPNLRSRRSEHP